MAGWDPGLAGGAGSFAVFRALRERPEISLAERSDRWSRPLIGPTAHSLDRLGSRSLLALWHCCHSRNFSHWAAKLAQRAPTGTGERLPVTVVL